MKNRSLISNSFFIFIIRFFPSLANLLVVVWYSRRLPQEVYGNYQHFWIQLSVLCPLACIGIHVLTVTYAPGFIMKLLKTIKARQYTLYGFWVLALAILFAALQHSALEISLFIPFLFLISYTLATIFESFLIVFRNYQSLVAINVIYSALFWGIHWFVLGHSFSLHTVFVYLLILTVLRLCIYWGIAIINVQRYDEEEHEEEYNLGKIRTLWMHLGVYDVTQILSNWVDKFIISLTLSAPLSAIYYNGSQNIPFLPLLLSAAGSAVLIQLARGGRKNETTDVIQLMNQMGRMLSCIVFPVFFFLLLFRVDFIVTIFTVKYLPAVPVFMAALFILPVRAYHFTTVLQRMHKGSIINIGAIAELILACTLIYPLYRWIGLPGVALSFVISTYFQATFYLFYSARLLQTSPLKLVPYVNWLVKLIVFATLFIAIRYAAYRYFTGIIPLILGGAMMIVMVCVSLLIEYKKQSNYGRR